MHNRLFGRIKKLGRLAVWGAVILCVLGTGAVWARLGGAPRQSATGDITLEKGLVGWWKFDGGFRDATPGTHNDSYSGPTSFVADRKNVSNRALSMNGTSNFGTVSNFDYQVMRPGNESSSWTMSLWAKAAGANANETLLVGRDGCHGGIYTWNSGYAFAIKTNACWTGAQTIAYVPAVMTDWHLLTAVYSAGAMTFYVDGTSVGTATFAATFAGYTTTLRLGGTGSSTWFYNGSIDDARVYNRALSAGEVGALYGAYNPGTTVGGGEKGLVGWWKMDGGAKNSTPYGNNGTVTNATLTTDRKNRANSAYSFNGTNATINFGNSTTFNAQAVTFAAWIKPGAVTGLQEILAKEMQYKIRLSGTSIQLLSSSNGTTWTATPTISAGLGVGNWYHVAGVIDAPNNTYTVYLNGGSIGTGALGYTNVSGFNTNSVYAGTYNGAGEPFNGAIDDLRFYGRAISASDAAALYSSYGSQVGMSTLQKGLVGDWPMNGTAKDYTPRANNGTVTGAVLTTDRKGRTNSAYTLGNSAQWINIGSPSILNGASGFTWSVWLMRTGASTYQWPNIMGASNTHVYYGIRSLNFGDSIAFEYGTSPFAGTFASTSSHSLPVNEWHNATITYDGSTLKYYWDGAIFQTVSSVTLNPTFGGLSFTTPSNGWQGTVDDARAYNRALDATEVVALVNVYR